VALLGVGLLAASAAIAIHAIGGLAWLERDSVDLRFSLRGQQRPSPRVVVVGIDNASLAHLPRYPFPRQLDARVLENLHAAGARLVLYDVAFDRPTTPEADEALFEAARRAAPVVFATSLISSTGATEVLGGSANLASIGDRAAAADLLPDADGVLRHTLAQVNGLPTIAAAVAQTLTGHRPARGELERGWIDFPGPPSTVPTVSFAHVLHDEFNPAAVRGKVVVIGATAPVLQDTHTTAAGGPMAGPEVQADAVSTVLNGFPLRSAPGVVTILLIVGLALLVPFAAVRLGAARACLIGLAAVVGWAAATQLDFDSGTVLDFTDPMAALLLGIGGTFVLAAWYENREHRRLRLQFASGQTALVEQVLHAPGQRRIEPTAIIAGYRLEEVIGRGGMGVVYRATQLGLDRAVAVKLIAVERAQDPVFRERFEAESRIAASIEHPNVIPVYEAGDDSGLLFITMRLIDGFDLRRVLELGPMATGRTANVITQLGGALDAAHAHGLVHRDVKPANVLLTLEEPEYAYLTDFGVAVRAGALTRVTRAGQWVGTLDYLAPEQIRGEPVGPATDVYALTCVLCHCLTGKPPFVCDTDAATMWAHISAPPPALTEFRPKLPPGLDDVVARGLAKDPRDRFGSAGALADAVASVLGLPTVVASEVGPTAALPPHVPADPGGGTILSE